MSDLHDRIACVIGWNSADVRSLSMQLLRDLVRPIDPDLARELDCMIQSGAYVIGTPARAPKARTKRGSGKKPHHASMKTSRSASKPLKRDPQIILIEGEPWRVERKRFWLPDTGGGRMGRAWDFVRVSDGRTMTTDDKERGIRIIAERIRAGTYAGPPMYRSK